MKTKDYDRKHILTITSESEDSTVPVENPDANGACQPEHTEPAAEQPQGGDTNSSDAVYVPGFGYVEPSGAVGKHILYRWRLG